MMSTENELLLKVALKNQSAFKSLYELTSAKLFGVVIRIIKDEGLAEDILQEAYIKVWDKADTFDPKKASAVTWMGTIARNLTLDKLRRNHAHLYADSEDNKAQVESVEDDAYDINPLRISALQDEIDAFKVCLQALPEKHQTLILASYLEGYSQSQLAETHQLPLGTVKTQLSRGVANIRQCMASKFGITGA